MYSFNRSWVLFFFLMLRCFLNICVSGLQQTPLNTRKVPFFFFFWSLPRQKILGHTVLRLSECDAANDTDTSQRKHCLHCWDWWPVMTGHQLKCRAGTIVALTFQAFAGQIASTILLIFAVQQRIFGIYFCPSLDLGPHRIAWPVNLKKKNSHHIRVFSALWRSRNRVDKCGEAAAGHRNCWLAFSITVTIMIIAIILLCFLFLSTRNGTTKNEMFPISWQRFSVFVMPKKKRLSKYFYVFFKVSLSQTFVFWLFSFHHRLPARLNLPVEHREGVLVLLRLCM